MNIRFKIRLFQKLSSQFNDYNFYSTNQPDFWIGEKIAIENQFWKQWRKQTAHGLANNQIDYVRKKSCSDGYAFIVPTRKLFQYYQFSFEGYLLPSFLTNISRKGFTQKLVPAKFLRKKNRFNKKTTNCVIWIISTKDYDFYRDPDGL
jgi:hypothetical protein